MTIKTLEYIHRLLVEEERKTKEVYNASRKLQHEYEDHGASKDLIRGQEDVADGFMHEHIAALNALEDFENHEW